MDSSLLAASINAEMNLGLPAAAGMKDIQAQLVRLVNDMITRDFQGLVQILYRVDVNEKKLKVLLQQNNDKDAAIVIAQLIIERQLEKLASRKKYGSGSTADDTEEKW